MHGQPTVRLSRLMQGKPSVSNMACVKGHSSREKPPLLMYAASSNIALCLKTDNTGESLVSLILTFDLLTQK